MPSYKIYAVDPETHTLRDDCPEGPMAVQEGSDALAAVRMYFCEYEVYEVPSRGHPMFKVMDDPDGRPVALVSTVDTTEEDGWGEGAAETAGWGQAPVPPPPDIKPILDKLWAKSRDERI